MSNVLSAQCVSSCMAVPLSALCFRHAEEFCYSLYYNYFRRIVAEPFPPTKTSPQKKTKTIVIKRQINNNKTYRKIHNKNNSKEIILKQTSPLTPLKIAPPPPHTQKKRKKRRRRKKKKKKKEEEETQTKTKPTATTHTKKNKHTQKSTKVKHKTTNRSKENNSSNLREMFYLTTHSTHFIYGYMASDIWLRTILIVRKETRCRHIGYSYRLTASHRQDNTYHGLCYTSRGALAGTRNS